MSVKRPTPNQMIEIVEGLGMSMTAERVSEFMGLMQGVQRLVREDRDQGSAGRQARW